MSSEEAQLERAVYQAINASLRSDPKTSRSSLQVDPSTIATILAGASLAVGIVQTMISTAALILSRHTKKSAEVEDLVYEKNCDEALRVAVQAAAQLPSAKREAAINEIMAAFAKMRG